MKVKELVERYQKNERIDLVKVLEVVPYISIGLKQQMAELVLDNSTTVVDGEVRINSIDRYILFTISVINLHTNLEFVYDDDYEYGAIDDYDALCESGLLTKIIDTFKDDYASCQEVLNMMTADKMQEHMTIERKITKLLDDVQNVLGNAVNYLIKNLDVNELLDVIPVDKSKLAELYNNFNK